ncbi:hypothetical protein QUB80_34395 [Chlorogloeopsis sp. ULAP01]|uniref:hypothetical protein n=1 Tax=Chlorogloeopsis sp. ULAP01 TaxID=3056483 RepID=UPI0025AA75FD|nr:hypothetical protein [Chlorogloeopsis sp. ULAP01]MDM9385747.1 hypothetical protein [Chlorogloeopsis sp. ULAP01]
MTPEKEIRVKIAQNIIEQCEILFSAQAWKFFQNLGRGYLYLHKVVNIQHSGGNNFSITEGVSHLGNSVHYVAKGSEAWNMAKLSQAAKQQPIEYAQFFTLIDNYNPDNEYVVIVGFNYGSDATEYWFLRKPEVPPQQAFSLVRGRPLEFGVELF